MNVFILTLAMLTPIVLLHILINRGMNKFLNNPASREEIKHLLEEEQKIDGVYYEVGDDEINYAISVMVDRVCKFYLIAVCFIVIFATMFIVM